MEGDGVPRRQRGIRRRLSFPAKVMLLLTRPGLQAHHDTSDRPRDARMPAWSLHILTAWGTCTQNVGTHTCSKQSDHCVLCPMKNHCFTS